MKMPRKRSLLKINNEDDEFECPIFQEDKDDKTKEENGDSSDESVNLTGDDIDSESDELDIDSDDDSDKEKNISRNQSLRTTVSDEDDDDDDNDEPEAVSFKSSKQSVLEALKTVQRQIDDAKQINKKKRRQQDEKYKEQKKRKLDELAKKKLPEDFFDELPDEIISKKKNHQKSAKNKKKEEEVGDDEEEASLADTEEDFDGNDQDFIPLENSRLSGGIVATTIKRYQTDKCKSSAEKAADFKNRQLFGGRIPRESSKAKLAKMAKKKVFVSR